MSGWGGVGWIEEGIPVRVEGNGSGRRVNKWLAGGLLVCGSRGCDDTPRQRLLFTSVAVPKGDKLSPFPFTTPYPEFPFPVPFYCLFSRHLLHLYNLSPSPNSFLFTLSPF